MTYNKHYRTFCRDCAEYHENDYFTRKGLIFRQCDKTPDKDMLPHDAASHEIHRRELNDPVA